MFKKIICFILVFSLCGIGNIAYAENTSVFGNGYNISGIAYGNGKFIAIRNRDVLISEDGIKWVNYLNKLIPSNADNTIWTDGGAPQSSGRISFANGRFYVCGTAKLNSNADAEQYPGQGQTVPMLWSSKNGLTWSMENAFWASMEVDNYNFEGKAYTATSVCGSNAKVYATAVDNSKKPGSIVISCIDYSEENPVWCKSSAFLKNITWAGVAVSGAALNENRFIAMTGRVNSDENGGFWHINTSDGGASYTSTLESNAETKIKMVRGAMTDPYSSTVIAVGADYLGQVFYPSISTVKYDESENCFVYNRGDISSDGWGGDTELADKFLNAVAGDRDTYIAVGQHGMVYVSERPIDGDLDILDRKNWTVSLLEGNKTLSGVATDKNGMFVLVGQDGVAKYSTNSRESWTDVTLKSAIENSALCDFVPVMDEERVITDTVTFTHPGIGLNKEMLLNMQTGIRNAEEPWVSAFSQYSSYDKCALSPTIYFDAEDENYINIPTGSNGSVGHNIILNMQDDSDTAYKQAIMWYITGNEVYRRNSIEIIRDWCKTESIGQIWDQQIRVSLSVFKFCCAADLLKYSKCENAAYNWTTEDNNALVRFLEIMKPKYDKVNAYMNQHSMCVMAYIAAAIFKNDAEEYKKAVNRITTNEELSTDYNFNTDEPAHKNDGSIISQIRECTYNPVTKENVPANIQLVEMGRDQAHAYINIGGLSLLAVITYCQGTVVNSETGKVSSDGTGVNVFEFLDHRLLKGANYICKYNLGYDVTYIPVGNYTEPSTSDRGLIQTSIGVIYSYYKYIEKRDDMNESEDTKYLSAAFEKIYPEGHSRLFFGDSVMFYTMNNLDCFAVDRITYKDSNGVETENIESAEKISDVYIKKQRINDSAVLIIAEYNSDNAVIGTKIYPIDEDYVIGSVERIEI